MRFSKGRVFLLRVPEGEELVSFVNELAREKNIIVGSVSGIGSLKNPKIGYFEEKKSQYKVIELKGTYELVSLMGNISIKEGAPFAHIHVALGDSEGKVLGGHLIEGEVFVAEVLIQELLGEVLERKPQDSGLTLWDAEPL